jgi:hypothetical protein
VERLQVMGKAWPASPAERLYPGAARGCASARRRWRSRLDPHAARTPRVFDQRRIARAGAAARDLRRVDLVRDRPGARHLAGGVANGARPIAAAIVNVLWRQTVLIGELPRRIDAAWRPPRDEVLARRLLAALVKSDDACTHRTWVLGRSLRLTTRARSRPRCGGGTAASTGDRSRRTPVRPSR